MKALGAALGVTVWPMCLVVPDNTRVRISVDADHGELQVLLREDCFPAAGASAEAYQDKYLDAGYAGEIDMVGCRWRVLFRSDDLEPTDYEITISSVGA